MKKPAWLAIFLILIINEVAVSQQKISFPAKDGLEVTADLYFLSSDKPYVILLHQARYSRGEYLEIAPKIVNLGYNCIAVDLRSGSEVNGVINETAKRAKEKGLPQNYTDAIPDIEAAIAYVKTQTDKPFVLWGSSYSASLALVQTAKDLRTKAVVAFSPGEYFDNPNFVSSKIKDIAVPVMVLSSKAECASVKELIGSIKRQNLVTQFCPTDKGKHGSSALWKSNQSSSDYWLAITMFFSKLK
ncbi:MAG: dienelactone hydrolase family protein [Bacteroidota bacterium]